MSLHRLHEQLAAMVVENEVSVQFHRWIVLESFAAFHLSDPLQDTHEIYNLTSHKQPSSGRIFSKAYIHAQQNETFFLNLFSTRTISTA